MPNDRHDEASLKALLPWLAAGKLSGTERERVQAWLDASPEGRAELAWWEALGRDLRAHTADQVAAQDGDLGLARFQQALSQLPPRSASTAPKEGWHRRWMLWWRTHWQSPALATCLLVIGVQAVLWQQASHSPAQLEALSGAHPTTSKVLMVAFEPTASEADIRALLQVLQAEIIGGPSALGLYRVRVSGDVNAARHQLEQAQGVVADVDIAD
jgi:anti-sigma factor RsiW